MRRFFGTLLLPLVLLALPGVAGAAANPLSIQLQQFHRAFPGVHLLVLGNDAPRPREIARFRTFLRRNAIPIADIRRDRELRALLADTRGRHEMEPTNWVLNNEPEHTVCLITLDRSNYRQAGPGYWKVAWGVNDRGLDLRMNPVRVGNWNLHHEMYHCVASRLGLAHGGYDLLDTLYEETSADTFAALVHLQQTGDRSMLEADVAMRQMYIGDDTEHYTSPTLRYLLAHPKTYNQSRLAGRSWRNLAFMAHRAVIASWPTLSHEALQAAHNPRARYSIHRAGMAMFRRLEAQQH